MIAAAALTCAQGVAAPASQAPATEQSETKYKAEVRQYKPGNFLEVDIGDKRGKTYDLTDKDTIYRIDPDIAPGRQISITEKRDPNGQKVVEVRLGSH
jgi:hypothetical protein